MITSRRVACSRRMWSAYAGKRSAPASAYAGKLLSCTTVGTSAIRRSAITSMRSVERPVPCSMQSMPASMSIGSTVSPKQCAVTRAPLRCAAAMPSANASAGNDGARSPSSREIQSPTSFTQPSPRCASCATYAASSAGSTSWA